MECNGMGTPQWKMKGVLMVRNLTQLELAHRTRINPTSISLFMRGRQNLSEAQLQKIAKELELPVQDIVVS